MKCVQNKRKLLPLLQSLRSQCVSSNSGSGFGLPGVAETGSTGGARCILLVAMHVPPASSMLAPGSRPCLQRDLGRRQPRQRCAQQMSGLGLPPAVPEENGEARLLRWRQLGGERRWLPGGALICQWAWRHPPRESPQ